MSYRAINKVDFIEHPLLMKLVFITFVIAGLQSSVDAATSTAIISANIVQSISLTNLSGMVFGDISAGTSAGTVAIDPTGARTASGGTTINTAISGSAATFEIVGIPNSVFAITLPTTVIITNTSGDTMVVDGFNSTPSGGSGLLDGSGTQILSIGSTMQVSSLQPLGAYTGIMEIDVNYN